MKEKYQRYLNQEIKLDRNLKLGIISLLIVFSGTFGFIYEFIFYFFNSGMKQFYWRGGNFLPWINIYAIGAIGICLLTFRFRKKPLKVFLISALFCGILEFLSGLVIYLVADGFRCWDYNTEILNFGNIGGFVCLRSVLVFGFSSLLLIYGLIPFCLLLAKKLNRKVFLTISFTLLAIVLFDEFYNLLIARFFKTPRSSAVYKKLGFHYVEFKR